MRRPVRGQLLPPAGPFPSRTPGRPPRCPRGRRRPRGHRRERSALHVLRTPRQTYANRTGRRSPSPLTLTGRPSPACAARPPRPAPPSTRRSPARRTPTTSQDGLLVALTYAETHLDDHAGQPSQDRGYGVMHLVLNPDQPHPRTGRANLTRDLRPTSSGGTPAPTSSAPRPCCAPGPTSPDSTPPGPDRLGAWYPATARYGTPPARKAVARLYADAVYDLLGDGVRTRVDGGEQVTLTPRTVRPEPRPVRRDRRGGRARRGRRIPLGRLEPGPPRQLRRSGAATAITTVVVHVTQGSYAGSISWFQNPSAQVSAHHVVRVLRRAGSPRRSARATPPGTPSSACNPLLRSAWSTRAMSTTRPGSPTPCTGLVGGADPPPHRQVRHPQGPRAHRRTQRVPGNDHTDPGPNWDWAYYMSLFRGDDGATGTPLPDLGHGRERPSAADDRLRTGGDPARTDVRPRGLPGPRRSRRVRRLQQRRLVVPARPRHVTSPTSSSTSTTPGSQECPHADPLPPAAAA